MKIHPQQLVIQESLPKLENPSTNKEIFTLWMKSLILGGKGCTVFDSKGRVVYRVDNYGSRCCTRVFLMDCRGNVLITILRKKFRLFSRWEGYKEEKKGACWLFQVRKCWKFTKKPLECEVILNLEHNNNNKSIVYKIEKGKSDLPSCRIVDGFGGLVAQMKRKESGGVILGDDVMTLVVEANIDHSIIMGIMVAYSLICNRI